MYNHLQHTIQAQNRDNQALSHPLFQPFVHYSATGSTLTAVCMFARHTKAYEKPLRHVYLLSPAVH